MLRFIIKTQYTDLHSGLARTAYFTTDVDVPEIEAVLTSGGVGESGTESHELVGVEILQNAPSTDYRFR